MIFNDNISVPGYDVNHRHDATTWTNGGLVSWHTYVTRDRGVICALYETHACRLYVYVLVSLK